MGAGGQGRCVLVIGGARSGKSRFAEKLVVESGLEPVYVATASAGDTEMAERIAHHRAGRDAAWRTIEEPLDLVGVLAREARPGRAILVDCLTLWLTNLMMQGGDGAAETAALVDLMSRLDAALVLVSNEVGLGIVPESPLGRTFRDAQGRLNQAVAEAADKVVFMAAGHPLLLKPAREEIRL